MIDEELTFEKYGYYSTDLTPKNGKRIVAVCNICGAIRYLKKYDYSDRCRSCAQKGKKQPPHTDETRQHMSAVKQCIPYEEWDGFTKNGAYCEKFDEACRERIREKYNRMCFLCGKHESEETRKLSVHHYDMDKMQGCDGTVWKLVPLCMCCHGKSHSKIWTARIEYLLENVWD